MTKARTCKGASQEWSPGVTLHALGRLRVWESARIEPPHSQVNSHFENWTPEFLESDFRGQNSSDWKNIYITKNFFERRCLKWAHMTHLDIWNTSYGQKKGQKSNCQIDFQPLNVKNCPDFLVFKWHVTYRWKALDDGYNFALDFISIEGLHIKLWPHKVARILILGISRLPFGSPGTKCHLDVGFVASHKVCYKGEGGGFPQVRAVVNLVSPSLPVVRPNTKNAPTMH